MPDLYLLLRRTEELHYRNEVSHFLHTKAKNLKEPPQHFIGCGIVVRLAPFSPLVFAIVCASVGTNLRYPTTNL
jgi:hypothetical protein